MSYQVIKSITPYFGVWLLTDFKPHPVFPPFVPYLVKLIRKPRCPFLWHQWEVKTMYRNSCPGSTPTHHKTQSFFVLSIHFQTSLGGLACYPQKTLRVSNKSFHTLLECVCYHQLQYPNQILLLILLQSVYNIAQFVLN